MVRHYRWIDNLRSHFVYLKFREKPKIEMRDDNVILIYRSTAVPTSNHSQAIELFVKLAENRFSISDIEEKFREHDWKVVVEFLEAVAQLGGLSFEVGSGTPIAIFRPQVAHWRPQISEIKSARNLRLSPLTRMELRTEGWVLHVFEAGVVIQLPHERFRQWLLSDCLDASIADRSEEELLAAKWLYGCSALSSGGTMSEAEISNLPYEHWDATDWHFHIRSREGRLAISRYSRWTQKNHDHRISSKHVDWSKNVIFPKVSRPRIKLVHALEMRESNRRITTERLISLDELGSLLHFSVGDLNTRSKTLAQQKIVRPYPSAGGLHTLNTYIASWRIRGLEPGFWHFRPESNAFCQVSGFTSSVAAVLDRARCSAVLPKRPAAVIVISSKFLKPLAKYPAYGYANILKELGAVLQNLGLLSAAFNIQATILGVGNIELFSDITKLDPFTEGSIGEFCLI